MKKEPNPNFYRVRYKLPPLKPKSHDKELFQDAAPIVLLTVILTTFIVAMGTLGLIPFFAVLLFCHRWIYAIFQSE